MADTTKNGSSGPLRFPATRLRRARTAGDAEAQRVIELVAREFGVSFDQLLHPSRCRAEVACVRMVAMYLCYVALGRKLATVGRLFGRDRTTAAYACAKMEDRRDDRAFDARIARLEELIADPSEDAAQFVEADRAAG